MLGVSALILIALYILLFHLLYLCRGIWWIGSPTAYVQWRGAGQQMRRIVQQPSTAERHHTDRFPKGMLLLPWKLFARTCRNTDALLWSRWNAAHSTRNGFHGYQIERASWLPLLQVWRFQPIKNLIEFVCFLVCLLLFCVLMQQQKSTSTFNPFKINDNQSIYVSWILLCHCVWMCVCERKSKRLWKQN